MSKKPRELNPEIVDNSSTVPAIPIKMDLDADDDYQVSGDNSTDSYFKNIVNALFDTKKNVSAKTEYMSVKENFSGAKLEFLADFCNMPYLHKFIHHLEIKRISLERKGRKEILMALEKREEELKMQTQRDMMLRFGLNP